jgi:rhamnosyltransferase subunit B
MRVLIASAGSHGDVFPFIAIGREMLARGHEVLFFGNPCFREYVTTVGMQFVPISTSEEYHRVFGEIAEDDPAKALKRITAHFGEICGDCYMALKANVIPRQTITVSSSVFFAPRLLSETDGVPCVAVHLAPNVIRSNIKPARSAPNWIHAGTPALIKRFAYWSADTFFLDPYFTKPLNTLRAALRLPPLTRIFGSWINEADCLIGMFPDWYAERQLDWPSKMVMSGFPLYDHGAQAPLADELNEFIAAGPAPVAFSAGTANANAGAFFRASVEACRIAGLRAILLSNFAGQIPASLPNGVIHVQYAPFGSLLPKLAAFVHHGGIGSTSQALKAGVPQLIRPVAYDQFDNSARAERLGVARELLPKQYSARAAATALSQLMSDTKLHGRCSEIAKRLADNPALQIACNAIEAELGLTGGSTRTSMLRIAAG